MFKHHCAAHVDVRVGVHAAASDTDQTLKCFGFVFLSLLLFLPHSHEVGRHPAEAHHDFPKLRTSAVQAHEVSNGLLLRPCGIRVATRVI